MLLTWLLSMLQSSVGVEGLENFWCSLVFFVDPWSQFHFPLYITVWSSFRKLLLFLTWFPEADDEADVSQQGHWVDGIFPVLSLRTGFLAIDPCHSPSADQFKSYHRWLAFMRREGTRQRSQEEKNGTLKVQLHPSVSWADLIGCSCTGLCSPVYSINLASLVNLLMLWIWVMYSYTQCRSFSAVLRYLESLKFLQWLLNSCVPFPLSGLAE